MSGVVVVAGIFEPGSVATLVGVEDEAVMRPPEGDVVSRRLVDEDGNVGFDELEIGARYFVTGYVNGLFVMVRTIGVDASAPDTELQQAPVQAETPVIGTQQAPEVPVAPEPPADAPDLGVGVPEAAEAASPVVEPEAAADVPPEDPAPPADPAPVPADPPTDPAAETETKTAAGDSTVTVESNLPGVTAETVSAPPASEPADPSVAPDVPADPAVSPDASAPAAEVPAETPQDAGAPAEAPAAAELPAGEPPAEATADVPVDPSAPVQAAEPAPAEVPAPEAAVADVPAPVTADEATALQGQAAGLGIETANLTVDQLREQITGRGATPAA